MSEVSPMPPTVSILGLRTAHEGPRSFHWFLASIFASAVGRNAYQIACAWILVVSGHGSSAVAAFFAFVSITELIASPIAGWMSDRYDRRVLYVTADAVRLAGASALAAMIMYDPQWAILLSAIVFAASDRVALTASQCMIPSVGNGLNIPTANSLVFFLMQSGSLCAASLTGFLLYVSTPTFTFTAMAVAFALSTICMQFVRRGDAPRHSLADPIRSPLHIDARLLFLGAVYALLYTGGMLISVVGPSFVFEELRGNAIDFGHLESAWSAGSILGVLLLIPLVRVAKICVLQLVILALTALFFAVLKVLDLPLILVAFAILGVLYNLGRVGGEVMLQSTVPGPTLGRAKGAVHCVGVLLGLILFGIIAAVADDIPPSTIFLTFAAILAAAVIVLSLCRPRV
ncbi:MFS transporter [Rhizobium leguminosarum]|uniref:MFS transporter n=2 Tax=Rhizobium leguminosarum TaxID=384 RepID=UPI002F949284